MKQTSALDRIRSFIWPRMGLRRYGKYLLRRLERLTASSHAVAAGVAAGGAVSMFPLIGFHFMLGLLVVFLTRGSVLALALGTIIGNPLTFPFIFSGTYQVGKWLLPSYGTDDDDTIAEVQIENIMGTMVADGISGIFPVWRTMMIGAIPISIATYGLLYLITRQFVTRSRKRRSSRQEKRY